MKTNSSTAAQKTPDHDVTASELAAFRYCAKAWHLEQVLRAQPNDGAERARAGGVLEHDRHGRNVRIGAWLGSHGRALILCMLGLAIALAVLAALIR